MAKLVILFVKRGRHFADKASFDKKVNSQEIERNIAHQVRLMHEISFAVNRQL
jgi:hypothetical protein